MHQFNVKSIRGVISPVNDSKKKFFDKLLKSFEDENMTFKITIENISKNINEEQIALYKAFIVKAAEHFGNSYPEMEEMLDRFKPKFNSLGFDYSIPIQRWSNKDLDDFINKSTAFLAEFGFNF